MSAVGMPKVHVRVQTKAGVLALDKTLVIC
jgi:hypothetical protein